MSDDEDDGGRIEPDGGRIEPDGGPIEPDGGRIEPNGGPIEPDGGRRPLSATRAWTLTTIVLAVVLAADQITKSAVRHSIVPGEEHRFLPGVELVNTRNHGVAFGFSAGSNAGVTALIAVALLVLLVYFALHVTRPLIWLPTGMLIGGAIGNVVDRLRSGSVTDFVKLPLGWPPFNLADASITIGILLLFFVVDHSRQREKERHGTSGAAEPGS